jgi:hypothetical protein
MSLTHVRQLCAQVKSFLSIQLYREILHILLLVRFSKLADCMRLTDHSRLRP